MQADNTGAVLYKLATEFRLTRNTMKDRLMLQKTIYLLQMCGLRLGYGFSWYRYGPYSQELVFDAYKVLYSEKHKYEERAETLTFNERTEKWLATFKDALKKSLDDPQQLELLASAGFVRAAWHPTRDGFAREFMRHKTRFFDGQQIQAKQVEAAYEELDNLRAALLNVN